jgi:DNA-directed RNA polymerase sigma subunit (sigma70/sigma32)
MSRNLERVFFDDTELGCLDEMLRKGEISREAHKKLIESTLRMAVGLANRMVARYHPEIDDRYSIDEKEKKLTK